MGKIDAIFSHFLLFLLLVMRSYTQEDGGSTKANSPDVLNDTSPTTTSTFAPLPEHYDETLLEIARKPVELNPSDTAKTCSPACGKGPQLACPEEGHCENGNSCCYDVCRKRQVCPELPEDSPNSTKSLLKKQLE